jgi:Co/Zn/Cd efflux system component
MAPIRIPAGVALSGSAWPDVLVGLSIALLFSASAVQVIRAAGREELAAVR